MPAVYCEQRLQYGVPFIKNNLLFCFLVAWDHFLSFQLIYAGVFIHIMVVQNPDTLPPFSPSHDMTTFSPHAHSFPLYFPPFACKLRFHFQNFPCNFSWVFLFFTVPCFSVSSYSYPPLPIPR